MIPEAYLLFRMPSPLSFNEDAETYDRFRPGYPEQLFNDIIMLSGMPTGGRILEIGCGSGQATEPFARRGYQMLCIDPGGNLLTIAERRLSEYPRVAFLRTTLEEWGVEEAAFDLVASATAFHWVRPEVGYEKVFRALKPGGYLALFWNKHLAPYTGFFAEVQGIYSRVVPEWGDPRLQPSMEEWISATKDEINASGFFRVEAVKRYPWSRTYNAGEYVRLLDTYSDHRSLAEGKRHELYEKISELIDESYGGYVKRPYLSVLFVAAKGE
jgi:SAM-dependent methyltransferase